MTAEIPNFTMGGRYNWRGQPERLIYLGPHHSNGWWHQFAKVDAPDAVWCEVRTSDLAYFEETKGAAPPPPAVVDLQAVQGERERFEAWATHILALAREGEGYVDGYTETVWEAWQAALAATPAEPSAPAPAVPDFDGGGYVGPDGGAPLTRQDRYWYEQGRLAERDPRTHAAPHSPTDSEPAPSVVAAAPAGEAEPMTVAEFFVEAKRLNLTADMLVPQLAKRPEFADCLPGAPAVAAGAQPNLDDLEEEMDEFVALCFQCARYERTSTDWREPAKAIAHRLAATPAQETAAPLPVERDERALFEAFFLASRSNRGAKKRERLLDRLPDGTYQEDHTQRHWWTWQTAIAALSQSGRGDAR